MALKLTDIARATGAIILSHICDRTEPWRAHCLTHSSEALCVLCHMQRAGQHGTQDWNLTENTSPT